MIGRNLSRRLKRLEGELAPPAIPDTLTVQATCATTGEVISEQHLVLHAPKRQGSRTSMWGGREPNEPAQTERLDRR
jgi:hypothetical protein